MSVANAGSAPATFEIKSANLPLLALRLKSTDLAALAEELTRQYGDLPDFFDHEPLVIDLTHLPAGADGLDFDALMALLRRYKLAPVAFKSENATFSAAALAAGLAAAPDAAVVKAMPEPPDETPVEAAPEIPQPPVLTSALVVDKPLRSGQQVYARGRDLVVLAMVNAGAEVISDGHIHVYAPLRGKAIAGARGNADARIFALSMEPELISIAGIYRTSEHALPPEIWGQPTQVRLVAGPDGERLVMDALK